MIKKFTVEGKKYAITDDENVDRRPNIKKYVIMQYLPVHNAWVSTDKEADTLQEAKQLVKEIFIIS